jgi:hemerythrin-like metal-binding protein
MRFVMPLKWNQGLCTGLEWQDSEHQELVSRIIALLEAMNRNSARSSMSDLISFLELYIASHFEHEEQFMRVAGYPALIAHQQAHEAFTLKFNSLRCVFDQQGGSTYVVLSLHRWLKDWLQSHINRMDRAMADFALEKEEANT